MTSPTHEAAERVPTVRDNGHRASADLAAARPLSPLDAPLPPLPVSPQTTEAATPVPHRAEPVSPEQQHAQAAQPGAPQRDAAVVNAVTDPEQQHGVHTEKKPPFFFAWKGQHMLLIILAFLLAVVGLSLSGHAAATGAFDLSDGNAVLAIPLPIYVLTIIFAIAETAVRASLKFSRGLHPSVHAGVWLICWIVYAGLIAMFAIVLHWTIVDGYYETNHNPLEPLSIAQFVILILLCLDTLTLFIMACVDTQAYNVAKATPPAADASGNIDPNHHEDRSWRMTKVIFNVLVIVFSIIGFVIGLSMVRFRDNYMASSIVFPACACALLVPIVWAVSDLCFALTGPRRRFLQGVHPGAHVGVWLISWILLAIVGGILTTSAIISLAQCNDYRGGNIRRSVGVDVYAFRHVPAVDAVVATVHVRQINAPTSTDLLATPTATHNSINTMVPTSTRIRGSLPTTTTSPLDRDPYDPYLKGSDDDSYEDPYYPYRPPTSRSSSSRPTSSSSSSRPTSSNYGSSSSGNGPSDTDRYRGYHNDPYDDERRAFCVQKGIKGPMIATCVFLWIVFVFAFVLFVAACADTYLRNHLRNPYTVVYVPVAAPYQYPQQPFYSGAGMPGVGKQPAMTQAPAMQQQQQQPVRPAQGNIVEYYGHAQ
ncbi:hypothetical protein CRV24_006231 [Beauveria bassiana]|nr:hypothetical protein CRV24_006231 [Beauveria bassiana]KAH8708767.1 hypothetical protein HC256_008707 [Beauveria bassiana]